MLDTIEMLQAIDDHFSSITLEEFTQNWEEATRGTHRIQRHQEAFQLKLITKASSLGHCLGKFRERMGQGPFSTARCLRCRAHVSLQYYPWGKKRKPGQMFLFDSWGDGLITRCKKEKLK